MNYTRFLFFVKLLINEHFKFVNKNEARIKKVSSFNISFPFSIIINKYLIIIFISFNNLIIMYLIIIYSAYLLKFWITTLAYSISNKF